MDIIRSSYYIHGPWGDENNFAVLYVLLCYGPYTLVFFTFISSSKQEK